MKYIYVNVSMYTYMYSTLNRNITLSFAVRSMVCCSDSQSIAGSISHPIIAHSTHTTHCQLQYVAGCVAIISKVLRNQFSSQYSPLNTENTLPVAVRCRVCCSDWQRVAETSFLSIIACSTHTTHCQLQYVAGCVAVFYKIVQTLQMISLRHF